LLSWGDSCLDVYGLVLVAVRTTIFAALWSGLEGLVYCLLAGSFSYFRFQLFWSVEGLLWHACASAWFVFYFCSVCLLICKLLHCRLNYSGKQYSVCEKIHECGIYFAGTVFTVLPSVAGIEPVAIVCAENR